MKNSWTAKHAKEKKDRYTKICWSGVKLYTGIRAGTHAALTEIYVGFFRPLDNRITIGARFTAPFEADPGAHPDPFKRVPNPFPGGESVGAGRLSPTTFRTKVKERVGLYFYSPMGPYGLLNVEPYLF